MPRIPAHTVETAPHQSKDTLAAISKRMGHACQSAHTVSAKAAGLSEEQTIAIRAGRIDFDDKLASIAEVARQIASATGTVSDEAWEAALAAGWGEHDLAETFAHVAVNLYTNYFNHFAGTELDLPEAPAVSA
jgi:alkylhydroperoxidase family enzyme